MLPPLRTGRYPPSDTPDSWQHPRLGVRVGQAGTVELLAASEARGYVLVDELWVAQTGGLIVQEQHQYAFGAPLPGLRYTVGGVRKYRYAYQGQYAEHDAETGFENFELRLYNSRVGRWLTTDPEGQFSSPYVGMGNNPVSGMDPDGAWNGPPGHWYLSSGRYGTPAAKGLSTWARKGLQAASSIARYTQQAVAFSAGAAGAYGSDMLLQALAVANHLLTGGYPRAPRSGAVAAGEVVGHAAAFVNDLAITFAGLGGDAARITLSATGIGTAPGLAVVAGSTAAIVYGGGVTAGPFAGLVSSGQAMLSMARVPKGSGKLEASNSSKGIHLGFKLKRGLLSKGQKVYEYEGLFYSKDVGSNNGLGSHNGGVWKVFEMHGN